MSPKSPVTRQMLEGSWRLPVEETQARYHKAQQLYTRLLEEQPNGTPYAPNGAVALARQAEIEALVETALARQAETGALAEYIEVLRALTALSVKGKIPEERPATGSDGI